MVARLSDVVNVEPVERKCTIKIEVDSHLGEEVNKDLEEQLINLVKLFLPETDIDKFEISGSAII